MNSANNLIIIFTFDNHLFISSFDNYTNTHICVNVTLLLRTADITSSVPVSVYEIYSALLNNNNLTGLHLSKYVFIIYLVYIR